MKMILPMLTWALLLGWSCPGSALSVKDPSDSPAPAKKSPAQKYLDAAERLKSEADKLEKRIAKLPLAQHEAAHSLAAAKRELADIKIEAAALWKQHLGELPEEFKPKLRQAQSKHSALSKEYYRIGREIKAAQKSSSASTNLVAPASVFGN
jgi:hypothetical protein